MGKVGVPKMAQLEGLSVSMLDLDPFWSKVPDHTLVSSLTSAIRVRRAHGEPDPDSPHEKLIALLEAESARRGLS